MYFEQIQFSLYDNDNEGPKQLKSILKWSYQYLWLQMTTNSDSSIESKKL